MDLCSIGKVGSRNLLKYLIQLGNESLTDEFLEETKIYPLLNSMSAKCSKRPSPLLGDAILYRLSTYSQVEIDTRMKQYKKVMFTRNPLDRFLSAWKDRFIDGDFPNYRKLGGTIIKNFRLNPTRREISQGKITLHEFFQYIDSLTTLSRIWDRHWRPMHETCYPCAIDYDFIGSIEQVDDDTWEMGKLLTGRKDLPKILTMREPIPIEKDMRYIELKKIPRQLVERVMKYHYQRDYDLFGYNLTFDLQLVFGSQ